MLVYNNQLAFVFLFIGIAYTMLEFLVYYFLLLLTASP